tara:strand:+ start:165 stop:635 length:471 start_codon:yes stop_codon:yes gene_type:complete
MLKKNTLTFGLLLLILLPSCGYKKINQDMPFININKIIINEVRPITFKLKNNIILISKDNAKNSYNIDLKIKKNKTSKIKNASGKVTRYTLGVNVDLTMTNIENQKRNQRSFSKSIDYNTNKIYSETINNEKNTYKLIIEELSEEIINFISFTNLN